MLKTYQLKRILGREVWRNKTEKEKAYFNINFYHLNTLEKLLLKEIIFLNHFTERFEPIIDKNSSYK